MTDSVIQIPFETAAEIEGLLRQPHGDRSDLILARVRSAMERIAYGLEPDRRVHVTWWWKDGTHEALPSLDDRPPHVDDEEVISVEWALLETAETALLQSIAIAGVDPTSHAAVPRMAATFLIAWFGAVRLGSLLGEYPGLTRELFEECWSSSQRETFRIALRGPGWCSQGRDSAHGGARGGGDKSL